MNSYQLECLNEVLSDVELKTELNKHDEWQHFWFYKGVNVDEGRLTRIVADYAEISRNKVCNRFEAMKFESEMLARVAYGVSRG